MQAPTASFLNYNSTNNTLTGGNYVANGGNITLPLGTASGITTLAASVTEENGGQIFNSNDSNVNALGRADQHYLYRGADHRWDVFY